jgi:oxygen-independent coproporphyrinogen III oxidase
MTTRDTAATVDGASDKIAAYVHVPFCARVCPYCDFNVVAGRDELVGRYVDAVVAEIGWSSPWRSLDSISIGGGTPSRVPPKLLGRIVGALVERFGVVPDTEIGLEANPEDWNADLSAVLRDVGFTRVSFGVQSFDPTILARLGRLHTPDQASRAVLDARTAGFSVNIDLIFGTPGETVAGWSETVRNALALEPDHLSTYALTVERGTALSRAVAAGYPAPDEDLQAEEYEMLDRLTGDLVRYEVSNYARPGHECLYNLITWAQGEYAAFGAGAHGHREGVRTRNVRRIDAYLDRIDAGRDPVQKRERLDPWEREKERLLLGLRRTAGAASGEAGAALVASDWGRRLMDAGVVAETGDRIVVQRPLLTDEVSRAVLALSVGDC